MAYQLRKPAGQIIDEICSQLQTGTDTQRLKPSFSFSKRTGIEAIKEELYQRFVIAIQKLSALKNY